MTKSRVFHTIIVANFINQLKPTGEGRLKLDPHPETELEYWEAIEGLGSAMYMNARLIRRGDIEDTDGSISQGIEDMAKFQKKLFDEICEKFGIIPFEDSPKTEAEQKACVPPDGKIFYWVWYRKLEREYSQIKYNQLLCSVCPFSQGLDAFIPSHIVHCDFDQNVMKEFRHHHIRLCPKVAHSTDFGGEEVTLEDIHSAILLNHGQEVLDVFLSKQNEVGSRFRDYQPVG